VEKISGRIMDYEIRENRGRIDTGIYSKGWEIIFMAGVNNTTTMRIKAGEQMVSNWATCLGNTLV